MLRYCLIILLLLTGAAQAAPPALQANTALKIPEPFLSQSTTVSPDEFGALPYVLALAQGLSQADKGSQIFVRGLNNPTVGQLYLVLHKKRDYINPADIDTILGVEADYIASAKVSAIGDPTTLTLTQVDQPVKIGDRLMLPQQNAPATTFAVQPPSKPVRAQIIASLIDYAAITKNSLVAINYGANEGAAPGQELLVTSELSVKKPVGKKIGTLVIFRTFPEVSWAIVTQMSAQIQTLNGVQSPS